MPNMIGEISTKFQIGEITAYRVWKVLFLGTHPNSITVKSIYYHMVWPPHVSVKREQDVWEEKLYDTIQYYGIHSFKSINLLKKNFECFYEGQSPTHFYAIGKVKLWGDIIEHEDGYRSEYAQIMSIDELPRIPIFYSYDYRGEITEKDWEEINYNFSVVQKIMN